MIDQELFNKTLVLFKPKYRLPLSIWANTNVVLSNEYSNETGRYQWERTPYFKEILDSFSDNDIRQITIKCSAQVGKTLGLMIMMGYIIQEDPAPVLLVFPDKDLASKFSTDKLDPFIRDTGDLLKIIYKDEDIDRKVKGSKILRKRFPGGSLTITGSNSVAGLSSSTIKYLFIDELHQCHPHAFDLARKRTVTYDNHKIVATSTPAENVEECRITEEYLASDQRKPYLPCPHCGHYQILRFDQLKFSKKYKKTKVVHGKVQEIWIKERHEPFYECEKCKKAIQEKEKYSMIAKVQWRKENSKVKNHAGFWISALYSPFETWESIVKEWEDVIESRTPERLRRFRSIYLGEASKIEGKQIDTSELAQKKEDFLGFDIPKKTGETILTFGVDIQHDRLEGEIIAWGKNLENWGVEYFQIPGDPKKPEVWEQLDSLLSRTWKTTDGEQGVQCGGIDSGDGTLTERVYKFIKPRQSRGWFATKGESESKSAKMWKPPLSRVSNIKGGIRLVLIGTNSGKQIIHELITGIDGESLSHFPQKECYNDAYFSMLTAEALIQSKDSSGYEYRHWKKLRTRNEALDIRVINLVAYYRAKPMKAKTSKRSRVHFAGISL